MNLCTNAYHAMRDTGGTMGVTLKDIEVTSEQPGSGLELSPGRYIRLEVSDTGIGMSEEIKAKVFEPYFTTKEQGEGTGLGLSVVHGIIEGHKGHINIYSEPGQGTTFRAYFPIMETADAVRTVTNRTSQLAGGEERIMVVDDEPSIITLESKMLTMYGYEVAAFTDVTEALQQFEENPGRFDLVVTDMSMPHMTGAQLAKKIFEISPEMPVILCSGHSELINREKALAMGIKEYLEKPVSQELMLRKIRTVLDNAKKTPA
jgi:CheY-like chemotaxis protein